MYLIFFYSILIVLLHLKSKVHASRIQSPTFVHIYQRNAATLEGIAKQIIYTKLRLDTNIHYRSSIRWIDGRRCLFIPSSDVNVRNEVASDFPPVIRDDNEVKESSSSSSLLSPLPPVVILGGMAQSISSWEHHLPILSKERDVFFYEYLGSGLGYRHPEFIGDNHDLIPPEVCIIYNIILFSFVNRIF